MMLLSRIVPSSLITAADHWALLPSCSLPLLLCLSLSLSLPPSLSLSLLFSVCSVPGPDVFRPVQGGFRSRRTHAGELSNSSSHPHSHSFLPSATTTTSAQQPQPLLRLLQQLYHFMFFTFKSDYNIITITFPMTIGSSSR